jgi:hypothetical protein
MNHLQWFNIRLFSIGLRLWIFSPWNFLYPANNSHLLIPKIINSQNDQQVYKHSQRVNTKDTVQHTPTKADWQVGTISDMHSVGRLLNVRWDSSTLYWLCNELEDRGVVLRLTAGTGDFLFTTRSRTNLGPKQMPTHLIPWDPSPRIKLSDVMLKTNLHLIR